MININNTDDWKDEVINSVVGMERAVPSEMLFSSIEKSITQVRELKPATLRWSAVAAIAILCLNIYAVRSYRLQENGGITDESTSEQLQLTTNLNIYDS